MSVSVPLTKPYSEWFVQHSTPNLLVDVSSALVKIVNV